VTETSHPLFGDRHIPFGSPGVVDIQKITSIMSQSIEMGFFNSNDRPSIFCEVLKRDQDDSLEIMRYCQNVLQQAGEGVIGEQQ
jgi:hypothetical protein